MYAQLHSALSVNDQKDPTTKQSKDYVALLGVLQACCDFTKPASADEERLLKSILSMEIALSEAEEDVLGNMQKELKLKCHHEVQSRVKRRGNDDADSLAEKVKKQESRLTAQSRHIEVLMEQNRILLEAAKYHQQKSTLVMAMHNSNNSPGGTRKSTARTKASPANTPLSAPLSGIQGTPSPGAFRQLRISTPPASAIPRLPKTETPLSNLAQTRSVGIGEQPPCQSNSTVLSQLMTSNALRSPNGKGVQNTLAAAEDE